MRRFAPLALWAALGGCYLMRPPPAPPPEPGPRAAFDPAAPGSLIVPPSAGVAPVAYAPARGTLQPDLERLRLCAETHARNIHHAETVGFKAVRRHGLGDAAACDWSNGPLEETGRELDLAIDGEGFLGVRLPDGSPAFTRGGRFHAHADGRLVTGAGLTLETELPVGAGRLTIGPRGHVDLIDTTGLPRQVGRLGLARFANPSGLDLLGHNLYVATAASGEPAFGAPGDPGFGRLRQGHLERANVDLLTETDQLLADQQALLKLRRLEDPRD